MFKKIWYILFPHTQSDVYGTVRYAFPMIFIAAIFASMAAVMSDSASFVTITSSVTNVTRDQQFYLDVKVSAHVPINAVDLVIGYPEKSISVDAIDTGTSVITLWTEKPYAKSGSIYLRGGTYRKGFIGEHTIARVKVTAKESGIAQVLLKDAQLIAGDGKGTVVATPTAGDDQSVRITVSGENAAISGKVNFSIVTDTDGDGDVDLGDISAFMAAWFNKSKMFDFNGDGNMTFRDFSILLADSFFK